MLLHTAGHTCEGLQASASTRVSACRLAPRLSSEPAEPVVTAKSSITTTSIHPVGDAVCVSQGSQTFLCNRSPLLHSSCRQQRTRPLKTCANGKCEAENDYMPASRLSGLQLCPDGDYLYCSPRSTNKISFWDQDQRSQNQGSWSRQLEHHILSQAA